MSELPVRRIVDDAAAAAIATAELVIAAAQHAVDERGVFHLCTTGGSTPAALYAALREPERAARMPWGATQIWFGDDRHVPRTSPLSNLASVDAVLLARDSHGVTSPIGNDKVHPWPTDEDGPKAVSDYLAAARAAKIQHTPEGFPQFDLVLIDPPYEIKTDVDRVAACLAAAHARWPAGSYAIWYPRLGVHRDQADRLLRKLSREIPEFLVVELAVRPQADDFGMHGSGMAIVNPPWRFEERLATLLPRLADVLALEPIQSGRATGWRLEWLRRSA